MTDVEIEQEDVRIKKWLAEPDYMPGTKLIDWTREQKRTNYTVTVSVTGYVCGVYSELNEEVVKVFFNEIPEQGVVEESCVNMTVKEERVNCDPSAKSESLCDNGKPNKKLKRVRFDGKSSCGDVSYATSMRYGESVEELEELCSENGQRRRLEEIVEVCSTEATRYEWNYAFTGTATRREPGALDDQVLHHHLHEVQDNHSQHRRYTIGSTYWKMKDNPMWVRSGFIEGVVTDMWESSHVYRCKNQGSSYLHLKGKMSGKYTTPFFPIRTNSANRCTFREIIKAGQPNPRYGVSTLEACFIDVDYGQNRKLTLGPRTTRVRNAWNNWV